MSDVPVGGGYNNAPELVVQAKRRLRELEYYPVPTEPEPDLRLAVSDWR